MLHRITLTEEVKVTGRDYFGRKAWIKFTPARQNGWWWQYHPQEKPVLITPEIVRYFFRRLTLCHQDYRLQIYEHIGVLRFIGLDGIIISGSAWPPYHGRPYEIWQKLKPRCKVNQLSTIGWQTIAQPLRFNYDHRRTGFLRITPTNSCCLTADIHCNYPGVGKSELRHSVPTGPIENAFKIKSQGWPPRYYYPSLLLSKIGWPTHYAINWPQTDDPKKVAIHFATHRLIDLLGAFSLLGNPDCLLAADIESECAGHEADLSLVFQANNMLVPLK